MGTRARRMFAGRLHRPVTWSDASFRARSPEIDLSALLALEAGTERELEEDEEALRLRRALSDVRAAIARLASERPALGDGGDELSSGADREDGQEKLVQDTATLAREYLARYRVASAAVATRVSEGEPAVDPASYRQFRERLTEFGEQAAVLARRSGRTRYVLAYAGPDAPGVVSRLTAPLAAKQFNVEAATMAVIGNVVLTAIVVSAPRGMSFLQGSASTGRRYETAAEVGDQLLAEVVDQFETEHGQLVHVLPRPGIPEIIWPRPDSSVFHVRVTARLPHGIGTITGEIAGRGLALLTFSTWRESFAQVIDCTVAVAPTSVGAYADADELLRDVQSQLEASGDTISVLVSPADRPRRGAPGFSMDVVERANVITVVGEARPGFVHGVIELVSQYEGGILQVVGANMALLEVFSVLTVVISLRDTGEHGEVPSQAFADFVRKRVRHGDEVLAPCVVEATLEAPSRHRPTHEITVEAGEQPGVLAKVASILSDFDPPVNIVWLTSYVLQPRIGEDQLRCWMQIQIDLSEYQRPAIDSLRQQLGWLARQSGWPCSVLQAIGFVDSTGVDKEYIEGVS